jgi:hypothetical protein
MPFKQVLFYMKAYDIAVAFQGRVVLIAKFGCNLVAYVYKLAEIGIVEFILRIMSQCSGIPGA